MKHAILCGCLMAGLSLTASAQIKVGDNPSQIVTGARLQVDGNNTTTGAAKLLIDNSGNMGVGTAAPGTRLDVNGAITNRETSVAIAANAASIPANTSQVQLTGAATANVTVTAATAPNSGQRLVVYNNTTGGFGATFNGNTILNGQAIEFIYSNGAWRTTDNGASNSTAASNSWRTNGNIGTTPANNFIGTNDNNGLAIRTNNAERVRIDQAGNVGIGTTTPRASLQFANAEANRRIVFYDGNNSNNNEHQYIGFGLNNSALRYQVDVTTADHVFFAGSGTNTSNELFRVRGNGNATLAGSLTQNSDIRLKKDITDNTYGLKEILKLRTINYLFKDETRGKDKKVGFIAQEVKAAMPELVSTANDDMKTLSVSYTEMTAVLTKAIQEQQAQIEKLTAALEKTTARNEQLEEQYNELRAEVKTIKTEVASEKYVVK